MSKTVIAVAVSVLVVGGGVTAFVLYRRSKGRAVEQAARLAAAESAAATTAAELAKAKSASAAAAKAKSKKTQGFNFLSLGARAISEGAKFLVKGPQGYAADVAERAAKKV